MPQLRTWAGTVGLVVAVVLATATPAVALNTSFLEYGQSVGLCSDADEAQYDFTTERSGILD